MSLAWPRVSLGELIRLERRPVKVHTDAEYQEIGIYCFGRGIFHKLPRTGLEVGDKDLFQIRAGDLILQVTFAWEGAIAVCSAAEDGLFGSTRYPTFRVDENRCDARFLAKYLCTRQGLDQINKICPGSAGRNRVLALKRLPEVTVPLPSLIEQRWIVAKIERLTWLVEEARGLKQATAAEIEIFFGAARDQVFSRFQNAGRLGDVALVIDPNPSHRYPEYLDEGVPIVSTSDFDGHDGISTTFAKHVPESFYRDTLGRLGVSEGDLIFSRKGKVGYARLHPPRIKLAMTHTLCVIQPDRTKLHPRFLLHYARSPQFLNHLMGTMNPNVGVPTLGLGVIRDAPLPVASLAEQQLAASQLDIVQTQVSELSHRNTTAARSIAALVPSILDLAFKGELRPEGE